METTYRLKLVYVIFCWIALIVVCGSFILISVTGSKFLYNIFVASKDDMLSFPIVLCLFMLIVFACGIGSFISDVKRLLKFNVVVFDNEICIENITVKWDEIRNIEHPKRTYGVAFRINAQDGRELDVYTGIENASEIENIVKSKLGTDSEIGG